jgi:hypothetical protein
VERGSLVLEISIEVLLDEWCDGLNEGLNFVIQDRLLRAMISASYATMEQLNREHKEASGKYAEAAKLNSSVAKLEPWLKIVGFAFLAIALIGSFVVIIP